VPGELGVIEDATEDAFGEQMLDERFFDGLVFEVGIDEAPGFVGKCEKATARATADPSTPLRNAISKEDFRSI
jgi:hypothetical protein